MTNPRTLILAFGTKKDDAKTIARGIVALMGKLDGIGVVWVTSGHGRGDGRPTLDITIKNKEDAVKVCEVLKNLEIDWEMAGPPCANHEALTTSAYDRTWGEVWKCFVPRCLSVMPVENTSYLTMTGLLNLRRSTETVTGRMSMSEPEIQWPGVSHKPDPGEAILSSFDFSHFEEAILYTYAQLVETPRNYRQFDTIMKAAHALQSGIPVAFEATPEGTDKLDEAVCRARNKDLREGQFIVQYQPMPHVMPDEVLAMARNLKNRTIQSTAVKPDWAINMMSERSNGIEPLFVGPPGKQVAVIPFETSLVSRPPGNYSLIGSGEDRTLLELAKAQMLGQTPKGATVLDIVALKPNEPNKNGDVWDPYTLAWLSATEKHPQAFKDSIDYWGHQKFDSSKPNGPHQIPREDHRSKPPVQGSASTMALKVLEEYLKGRISARRVLSSFGLEESQYKLEALQHSSGQLEKDFSELAKRVSGLEADLERLQELREMAEKLVGTVAGMNLQDQPLKVQKEVREALHAVMKALKGEGFR